MKAHLVLTDNSQDILVAMGIVGATREGFGLEAAGVVSRIGPMVKNMAVGDRVMYLGHGTFASHSVVSEDLCAKMPDNLSFEDGATMPCVYTTSIYSLFHVGHLERGEVWRHPPASCIVDPVLTFRRRY